MSRLVHDTFLIVLIVSGLSGCGQSTPSTTTPANSPSGESSTAESTAAPASAGASEIVRKDAAALPIGDYLPPLDDGRVEIATPKGWQTMPRDSDHVVRFYHNDRNGLPRIDVTVEERSLGPTGDLSEATLPEFVKQVSAEVEAKSIALLEPVIPMVIGSHPCARYVSQLNLKIGGNTVLAERQTLLLSHGGRLYTITLLTRPSNLKSGRDAAYAVCASFKFLAPPPVTPAATEASAVEPVTGTP